MRKTKLFSLVAAAFLVAAPCALSGCAAGPPPKAKTAAVQPGEMPPGATWDGVYYNALFGYLHIIANGNTFEGRWRSADESAFGQMSGTITGDIARFDWTENKVGMIGAAAKRSGKGYFRYTRPEGDNVDDKLLGEYGNNDAEIGGGSWDCIKQRNKAPDFSAVSGEAEPGIGTWK